MCVRDSVQEIVAGREKGRGSKRDKEKQGGERTKRERTNQFFR